MKKQDTVNKVKNNDDFSSGLMESYGKWMGGDCFQNTTLPDIHEAPFDGMDPQSNGAEIEQTSIKKKEVKKVTPVGAKETAPKKEEYEVLEREEVEIEGETYILEKAKGLDGKACWKGYKLEGTKKKGGKTVDNCVKAGDELEHDGEQLDEYGKAKKKSKKYLEHHQKDKDGNTIPHEGEELTEKKLDPVGKEDGDVDNDGDKDKSDKYLIAKRKKVGKIIAMSKKK